MIDVKQITQGLGGKPKPGGGFIALCPAHDDKNPSLSIDVQPDGKILLKCFAGCSQEAVVEALRVRGLWPLASNGPRIFKRQEPSKQPSAKDVPQIQPRRPYATPETPTEIRHHKLGTPSATWEYHDSAGSLIGYACRFDTDEGKKVFPYTFGPDGWQWKAWTEPRPLYGLDRLAERPDVTVLVVEGEKTADAAQRLFTEMVVLTWPGGSSATGLADFRPLIGRRVVLWPDADAPGKKAMNNVVDILQRFDVAELSIVNPPQDVKRGWDLADAEVEGWDTEKATSWIKSHRTAITQQIRPDQIAKKDPALLLEGFAVRNEYISKLGKEEFYFPDLIIKRHILTIIAMPGGGKTTFFYYHVAPILADNGLTVWYIDADSPASDHKKMKEVADRHGFKFLNPDTNEGTSMEGLLATLHQIAESHADLDKWVIFIDTLKKAASLMSKDSVKEFYQLARKLTALGATIVLLGHANKYRDKDGNLVFEGVGDVRSDSDELIYFERKTNLNGGIDITTVVDPDRGAKVRGIFKPFSFHVSQLREIRLYESALPLVELSSGGAILKASDDEILEAAKKYLLFRGEAVVQKQLVRHAADQTGTGEKRVRSIVVQNAEPRDAMHRSGLPMVYFIGEKNSHFYELPR